MLNGTHRRPRGAPAPTHGTASHGGRATRLLPIALAGLCGTSLASPALAAGIDRPAAITSATNALWQAPEQSLAKPGDTFTVKDVVIDEQGRAHVRFSRKHDDIHVIGGDLVVHLHANGTLRFMSVAQQEPVTEDSSAQRTAASARSSAIARFGGSGRTVGPASLVYDASAGEPQLAYEVVVRSTGTGVPSERHVLTDADTGANLRDWDAVHGVNGTGKTQYSDDRTLDTTALPGGSFTLSSTLFGTAKICNWVSTTSCPDIVQPTNIWGDNTYNGLNTQAADASFAVTSTLGFLDSWFGRSGLYSDGTPLKVAVNYAYPGGWYKGKQNPAYNIELGPGTPEHPTKPFTSVDIAAHEIGHGLNEDTAFVAFDTGAGGEPGGINESIADIVGTLTEFYSSYTTGRAANYTLGEDLRPGSKPYRSMVDPESIPHIDGFPPGTSVGCWEPDVGEIDDHYSSGIGNKFFFMLAEGSTGSPYGEAPTCGAPHVEGIGRWYAANIFYRALTAYMVSTTKYVSPDDTDFRAATLYAAADLYDYCSPEYQSVQAAWDATNVDGEDPSCELIVDPPATPATTTSLTSDATLGATVDWIHWKQSTPSTFDRKNAPQRISTWSIVGPSGNTTTETTSPTTFSWTDAIGGTPSGSATTGTGRKLTDGRGLSFNVPFSANESRTLRVFVGVRGATTTGTLWTSLGSGTPIASTVSGNSTTAIKNYVFKLKVHPSAATNLNVKFVQTNGGNATGSAVVLYGAALH